MSTTVKSLITTANRILTALPLEEYERLSTDLEPVSMPLGEILCHPDEPITHVYFPNRGTVSLVSNFDDGRSVEVGMVGNEGMGQRSALQPDGTTHCRSTEPVHGRGHQRHYDHEY